MSSKPLYLFHSSGMARIRTLQALYPEYVMQYQSWLQASSSLFWPSLNNHLKASGILIWGKKTHPYTIWVAKKQGKPLAYLEDGFLRSVEPGSNTPISLIFDNQGIYYDATHASDLERHISSPLTDAEILRTKSIRDLWCCMQVSKYNHAPDISDEALFTYTEGKPFILLIDQTVGDASIEFGLANAHSFEKMLLSALEQETIEKIVIKSHPEVVQGKKKGYLTAHPLSQHPRIVMIDFDIHLPSLLSKASSLYTVTSQSGFEALLWDIPVRTFGMPFYAGWGLTQDELSRPERRTDVSLEQLIHAGLVLYPRYLDLEIGQLCEVENAITYLGLQRKNRGRFEAPLRAPRFSRHKLSHLKRFTQGALWHKPNFKPTKNAPSITLQWGALHKPLALDLACQQIQVEDGFLRSIGLGALLAKPFSWVFDRTGMYYDATRPSDLELLLQTYSFSIDIIERARLLQDSIIRLELTKYNQVSLSDAHQTDELEKFNKSITSAKERGQKVALVIGQVETDASIRLGGIDIFTNADLLKAARARHPEAFLVYKPHPDVVEGVRSQKGGGQHMLGLCDMLAPNQSLPLLLKDIDEVHTISSLGGFEALIRNKTVYCYGMPFYAGWGLTIDAHSCRRRTRRLTLLELITGSLIMYPIYLHPRTESYCTPESLIYALGQLRDQMSNTNSSTLALIKKKIIYWFMKYYHQFKKI